MHTQVIIHFKNKGILIKATGFPLSKRPPVLISAAIYQKRLCFCKFCLISPSVNQNVFLGLNPFINMLQRQNKSRNIGQLKFVATSNSIHFSIHPLIGDRAE